MALVLADRVKETTNTTGTGTLTLAGAASGFQSFAAVGNANTTYYSITSGTDWEVGIGTYTASGTTLSRDTVISSSAGGAKISVAAGAEVFVTYPATKAIYEDANGNVGINIAPTGLDILELAAGTSSVAPLGFTSGALLTTPDPGSVEFDGKVLYFDAESSQRGVVSNDQFVILTADHTTPAGTANTLKQAFNATTNGALTVAGSTTYIFECMLKISTMSATAGTLQFGFGGTATYTRVNYIAIANKTALTVQTASSHTFGTAATATVITASNTTTTGYALVRGTLVIGTGGTIVPSIALSIANACVVQAGSYFKLTPIGSNTVTQVGNWS